MPICRPTVLSRQHLRHCACLRFFMQDRCRLDKALRQTRVDTNASRRTVLASPIRTKLTYTFAVFIALRVLRDYSAASYASADYCIYCTAQFGGVNAFGYNTAESEPI